MSWHLSLGCGQSLEGTVERRKQDYCLGERGAGRINTLPARRLMPAPLPKDGRLQGAIRSIQKRSHEFACLVRREPRRNDLFQRFE